MPYRTLTFKEFIEKVGKNYNPGDKKHSPQFTPFAWLVGAGLSATSIPLAKEVCEIIAVYQYYHKTIPCKPWNPADNSRLLYEREDEVMFFKWWKEVDRELLKTQKELAKTWIVEAYSVLSGLEFGSANYYEKLFKHVIDNKGMEAVFISSLIVSGNGINLANLGLAGIARDRPEWGNTIFTTNFDDLILRALLSLGHSATILGQQDLEHYKLHHSPVYPQVVHLHGIHSSLSIKNTGFDHKSIDPGIKQKITTFLEGSNLIVLGYSGWQDLAKGVLTDLSTSKTAEGAIFWVPWKNERYISDEMKALLHSFPEDKVFVIQNNHSENDHHLSSDPYELELDADTFILLLCQYLNGDEVGIDVYRNELLNGAAKQHKFVLDQQENSPKLGDEYSIFSPKRGKGLIKQAQRLYADGDIKGALDKRAEAAALIREDLPDNLKAELHQAIGLFDLQSKRLEDAQTSLKLSLESWLKSTIIDQETQGEAIFDTRIALAEAYLLHGKLAEAFEQLPLAGNLVRRELIKKPEKALQVDLMYALYNLYSGNGQDIKTNLKKFNDKKAKTGITDFNASNYPRLFANYHFISGLRWFHYFEKKYSNAKADFQEAERLYESLGQEANLAACKYYLAYLALGNNQFDLAEEMLNECRVLYEKHRDRLGMANVLHAFGDLHFRKGVMDKKMKKIIKGEIVETLNYYQRAAHSFDSLGNKYNLMNALSDIVSLYKRIILPQKWGEEVMAAEDYETKKSDLESLLLEQDKNMYAQSALDATRKQVEIESTEPDHAEV